MRWEHPYRLKKTIKSQLTEEDFTKYEQEKHESNEQKRELQLSNNPRLWKLEIKLSKNSESLGQIFTISQCLVEKKIPKRQA